MGHGHYYHCEKCNLDFEGIYGVGMMFPMLYEETIQKGKAGQLGEDIKHFLAENPDGVLDVSYAPYICKKCGTLESELVLTMYLPKNKGHKKDENQGRWSVAYSGKGMDYDAPWDLKELYKFHKIKPHYCSQCRSRTKRLTEQELNAGIRCPSCGELMMESLVMWD